jgi:hypothetical protein
MMPEPAAPDLEITESHRSTSLARICDHEGRGWLGLSGQSGNCDLLPPKGSFEIRLFLSQPQRWNTEDHPI